MNCLNALQGITRPLSFSLMTFYIKLARDGVMCHAIVDMLS